MTTILIKKKDTTGAPSSGDLTNAAGGAEIAVNTFDKRLYTKDASNNVVEVGTNPTEIQIDNININGNAITSTNSNGNIALTPNGTGEVDISKVDIDSGAIDGTTIGGASAAAGSFTTLNTSGAVVFNDAGADVDFRVEGDTDANLLFVDASTDRIGMGSGAPSEKLTLSTSVSSTYASGLSSQANPIGTNVRIENASSTTDTFAGVTFNPTNGGGQGQLAYIGGISTGSGLGADIVLGGRAASGYYATRMTLDSSGNVGIGTSSPSSVTNYKVLEIQGTTVSNGGIFQTASTDRSIQARFLCDASAAYVAVNTNHPLAFQTNSTERARITSGGYLKASNNASYIDATGSFHEFNNNADGNTTANFRHTGSSPYGLSISFSAASPDNNSNYFLTCGDSTASRMFIYSDGDVWTSDAGTLSSDQKLKNTITDASPKLDDVMRLRVRNFYWNEDYHPEKTDKKLIGFIAQEFEEVFPGLVTEGVIRGGNPIYEDQAVVDEKGNPVLDEEGNAKTEQVQVGETEKEYAKGIKEGKLIPILVKALQEAVERIETLEAKVAALENA